MTYDRTTPEARAAKRADELTGVYWHVAVYAVVNALLLTLDWLQGDGRQWAYWITIFWGVGLAFHLASYFIDDSGFKERKYQQFLREERERQA